MLGETVGSILFNNASSSGYLITTTNNTLGIIQTPQTKIFHIHLVSGATPSNITIQNGQGGTTLISVTGIASKGANFDFGWWGITFPLGAYVTYDGNQTSGGIVCKGEPNYSLQGVVVVSGGSDLLLEDGTYILLESGDKISL